MKVGKQTVILWVLLSKTMVRLYLKFFICVTLIERFVTRLVFREKPIFSFTCAIVASMVVKGGNVVVAKLLVFVTGSSISLR